MLRARGLSGPSAGLSMSLSVVERSGQSSKETHPLVLHPNYKILLCLELAEGNLYSRDLTAKETDNIGTGNGVQKSEGGRGPDASILGAASV